MVPPGDPRLNGTTYAQWAAAWWQWALEIPRTNSAGLTHPFIDDPSFDIGESQTSEVWFLGAPFLRPGTTNGIHRHCQIPSGKALFFPLFNVECSNIEPPPFYGETAEGQAAVAQYFANRATNLFCEFDGVSVQNVDAYRAPNPQISFNAPAPWIQSEAGGIGTSSGDGYFVFLSPMSPGEHTLRFGGSIRLTWPQDLFDLHGVIDITYHITVAAPP